VLLGRDAYLLYGAYKLERYQVILPVTYTGKLTTAVLFTGFASLIAGWPEVPGIGLVETSWLPGFGSASSPLGIWFVYVGVVLSLSAAVQYTLIAVRARTAAIEAERG
jgi:cardiolipin synthase